MLSKYCQNIVKKDSLYPLIKHHVPLCMTTDQKGCNFFSYLYYERRRQKLCTFLENKKLLNYNYKSCAPRLILL
jgi:hypothetical protein